MMVTAIVPARMGSKRFPGKPLATVAGQAMVRRVYEAARSAPSVFRAFVATADPEIVEYCEREKVQYIVTPRDCATGTERVACAARALAFRDPDEVVVNVQGDEPLLRPETIEAAALALSPGVDIASVYRELERSEIGDRGKVKVLVAGDGFAIGFTRSVVMPSVWRLYKVHVGIYAFRRSGLERIVSLGADQDLEQTAWMRAGLKIAMVEAGYRTIGVDTPQDLAEAERLIRSA